MNANTVAADVRRQIPFRLTHPLPHVGGYQRSPRLAHLEAEKIPRSFQKNGALSSAVSILTNLRFNSDLKARPPAALFV
jgi:hypothetical protein